MNFPWIKRGDLIAVPHEAGGWVVKDPLTLQYALLNDDEFDVLNLMDGSLSFSQLLRQAQSLVPAAALSASELAEFVRSLAGNQLIRQATGGDSVRLSPAVTAHPVVRMIRPVFQVLKFQVRLLNPTRAIDAAMPFVTAFIRPTVMVACLLCMSCAMILVSVRFQELAASLPTLSEFLGPQNIVLMLIVFLGVKVVHEAAHAFTARYFGAECNECGVMMMVFTPVLYTSVTDSWLLPRRQRLLVTAAGIFVELMIASVCTMLWCVAAPGLTRSVLLNTMLICSVNTILFNGNPLLRFDGYFLLADWAGLPNLAGRSSQLLRSILLSLMTGRPIAAEDRRRPVFLVVYGVLSAIYRLILTMAILKLVVDVTTEWRVEFIGSILVAVIVTGFLLVPILGFASTILNEHQKQPFGLRRWMRVAVSLMVILAGALVPLPQTIVVPAYVQPDSSAVYAPLGGKLVSSASYGQEVESGRILVQLHSAELLQTHQDLVTQRDAIQRELDDLRNNPVTSESALIPGMLESLKAAQLGLQQFQREMEELTVRSQDRGTFLPPPARGPQELSDLPVMWSGVPAEPANIGAWIERGTLLGYVGTVADIKLLIAVNEDDVELLAENQPLTFVPAHGQVSPCEGRLEIVGRLESAALPAQFATSGLMSGQQSADGLKPAQVTFLSTGVLNKDDKHLPAMYSTGHVRIRVRRMSLLSRFARYLRQTF